MFDVVDFLGMDRAAGQIYVALRPLCNALWALVINGVHAWWYPNKLCGFTIDWISQNLRMYALSIVLLEKIAWFLQGDQIFWTLYEGKVFLLYFLSVKDRGGCFLNHDSLYLLIAIGPIDVEDGWLFRGDDSELAALSGNIDDPLFTFFDTGTIVFHIISIVTKSGLLDHFNFWRRQLRRFRLLIVWDLHATGRWRDLWATWRTMTEVKAVPANALKGLIKPLLSRCII